MRKLYFILMCVMTVTYMPLIAQISLPTINVAYNQDFNTLATTATSSVVPSGWFFLETGTNANTVYTANAGAGTSGDTYSYGTGTSTERALGGLLSGSLTPVFGAWFTNNTGTTVTTLDITYTGEQWRLGATGRADRLDFQYSLNATDLATGTWTDVNAGDFSSPFITTVGALDGNAAANRTAIAFSITGLSLANGASVFIRWTDFNAAGADDGLAVDDFSITPTNVVTTTVSVTAGPNAFEPASNGSFTITLSSAAATDITVNYDFTGSDAVLGTDFSDPEGGDVLIPAGQLSAVVPVNVINDAIPELTQKIILNITGATAPYTPDVSTAFIWLSSEDLFKISFTGIYTQDFNTLSATTASSVPPTGWTFSESGSSADTTYGVNTGSNNAGNTYSFGAAASTERAFGGLRSGAVNPLVGALFVNNTGATVTSLTITYTGEQWRLGTTGRNDRLDFQYSLNATSLTTGTWVNADGLDFIAPNSTGTAGAFDGNATGNRIVISSTINGLLIPNGASFTIRWQDFDVSGAEDGLGIDDFTMTLGCIPPVNQPTLLNLVPSLQSIAGSFTAADPGTVAADAYLVLVSTTPALSELPSSGTSYVVDDVIGDARVVSTSSTSFSATGLIPSTTYYFFVFSSVSASNCYNITTPLIGSIATTAPPVCSPPGTQAGNLSAANITGTSMDLTWTRGTGDNVLIIARNGGPASAPVYNSVAYPAGTQVSTGNFVIYNGTGTSFSYTGLSQNSTYYFSLYEYNSADNCYLTPALTGNFTTLCIDPVNVTALNGAGGNAQATISWSVPSSACYDELIVVASIASVAGAGGDYVSPANTVYAGGEQVVYRGTGNSVIITGLTNGTTYFFKVFTRKGSSYSSGIQTSLIPFDPSTGYTYLFGNLHAHSSYSDGNKDNTANTPQQDFEFARDALCMDFLGISEHNHSQAGMNLPDFALGFAQANSVNGVTGPGGNSLVTLWGMEWGIISGGGHVLVYGFDDQLLGWEPGNYNILVPQNDYSSLWTTINSHSGAFATLAHPGTNDYDTLRRDYNPIADEAIVGQAIESGPAFSKSTTYNDFPSALNFLSYYRNMLSKGYRMAPQMDQDNHNLTFGTANSNRMVVLSSARSRGALMEAIRSMRYYASNDCNLRIDFKNGLNPMGSQVLAAGVPALSLSAIDPDAEQATSIELWGAEAGASQPASAIKTFANTGSFTFTSTDLENVQPNNTTWYYYAIVTQEDGNKAITAPIWYTRNDLALPVSYLSFRGEYDQPGNQVHLSWTTAQESNSKEFIVERSADGSHFTALGKVAAAGNSTTPKMYAFTDLQPFTGNNFYRLKQVDMDLESKLSNTIRIVTGSSFRFSFSPNPARGIVTLLLENNRQPALVQLVDMNGRVIRQKSIPAGQVQRVPFGIQGVANGMYLLRLVTGEQVLTEKVVIE